MKYVALLVDNKNKLYKKISLKLEFIHSPLLRNLTTLLVQNEFNFRNLKRSI